jgi:hypothetical protein
MKQAEIGTDTLTLADLQAAFQEALKDLLLKSREIDPFAVYMLRRLEDESGLELAQSVLAAEGQQTGLLRLWQGDRLEISVEALVLRREFRALFSSDELAKAKKRLTGLDYKTE